MARHVPAKFLDKVHLVNKAYELARREERLSFALTSEVAPGVRFVLSRTNGETVVFTLWTSPADIVELCGDSAYPASAALLSIEKEQARDLDRRGIAVDLSQLVRSEAHPGTYYVLLDYASREQIQNALCRLVTTQQASVAAVA